MASPAANIRSTDFPAVERRAEEPRRERWKNFAEVVILIGLTLAVGVAGFRSGWKRLNSDFPNYYTAANLYLHKVPLDRAYEWTWFQRQAIRYGVLEQPLVGFVPQPPLNLVPVLPLAGQSPLPAKRIWLVLTALLLLGVAWLVSDVTQLGFRISAIVTLACAGPLAANFRLGQYYVLILALLLLAYREFARGRRFRCGAILAIAASLKLFPFGFALFFILRREWRALAGLVGTAIALAGLSVALFGMEVHRVLLLQVLPRAARGELLAPYAVSSFLGLSRHLFLFEPQLNPFPLFRSVALCALLQAGAVVVMFALLSLAISKKDLPRPLAWSLAALWMSAMSALAVSYHYSVLIFPVAIAIDHLWKTGRRKLLLAFTAVYVVGCSLFTSNLTLWLATTVMFGILLCAIPWERPSNRQFARWTATAALLLALLTWSNLRVLRGRERDHERRTANSQTGIRASSPKAADGAAIAFSQMYMGGYRVVVSSGMGAHFIERDGRILSLAGSKRSPYLYVEVAGATSNLYRVDVGDGSARLQWVAEGNSPALSADGQWLVFCRDHLGHHQLFRQRTDATGKPELLTDNEDILEAAVNDAGDVIASVGPASRARLIMIGGSALGEIAAPVRYPAWSADGQRLAFSRRQGEWWQISTRDLKSGVERQLTDLPCNAVEPFWNGDNELLYSSDCGRGLGLSAISRITAFDLGQLASSDEQFLHPHDWAVTNRGAGLP